MKGYNIIHVLIQGWIATIPLTVCSILSLAVLMERWYTFFKAKISLSSFLAQVRDAVMEDRVEDAIGLCDRYGGPVAAVVKAGLQVYSEARTYAQDWRTEIEEMAKAMDSAEREQVRMLERYVPIVGSIASMAPYMGLFGTTVGIIKAFWTISKAGSAGHPDVIAGGIAEALINTAVGLLLAILSTFFYNWMTEKVKGFTRDMDSTSDAVINIILDRTVRGNTQ
jgi:biopolymer transport protein ExbB